jgi:limonene-1,2-epoxide hydrolase
MRLILTFVFLLTSNFVHATQDKPMSYADRVKDAWTRLDANNLQVVDEFYDKDLEFHDPIGSLKGRENMRAYYKKMYKDLKSIKFEYQEILTEGNKVALVWKMTYAVDKLNNGEPIMVDGMSIMKFGGPEDKVVYHRDYFDIGTMVYEHVPVLGWAVRTLRGKLAEH